MIESASNSPNTGTEMAPILAIGGLLSFKMQWHFYKPLLKDPECELSVRDRYLPVPDGGLGTLDETYGQLEEQVNEVHERLDGQRAVVAGHSLGGLMATMIALEHPDKVAAAICVAGAQEGIRRETLSSLALRLALRHPPGEEHIQHDSDFMVEHKEKIANTWSSETSLHLISPTYDDLLLLPQGLRLEAPEGQKIKRRVIGLPVPGAEFLLRRIPGMPKDVKILPSVLPAGHIDIARSAALRSYSEKVRREAVAETANQAIDNLDVALPQAA